MKTNGSDLAFDGQMILKQISKDSTETHISQAQGLTKREYFAAMAMQGSICANDHCNPDWITEETAISHARKAVMLADALIKELNQPQG